MILSGNGTIIQNATHVGSNLWLNGTEELKYRNGAIYWSVSAYNNETGENGILVNRLNVSPGMGIIPAEVVLKKAEASKSGVTVTWKKAKNADKYYVYRKTGKDGTWKRLTVTTALTFTDKTAKAGKEYYYTVKGYNSKKKIFGDMNTKGLKAVITKS